MQRGGDLLPLLGPRIELLDGFVCIYPLSALKKPVASRAWQVKPPQVYAGLPSSGTFALRLRCGHLPFPTQNAGIS